MSDRSPRSSADSTPEDRSPNLLDVLRVGAVLRGLVGPAPVTVVSVTRHTDDSASLVYRTEAGIAGAAGLRAELRKGL